MEEYLVVIDSEFVHPAEFRVAVFAVDISDLQKTLETHEKAEFSTICRPVSITRQLESL